MKPAPLGVVRSSSGPGSNPPPASLPSPAASHPGDLLATARDESGGNGNSPAGGSGLQAWAGYAIGLACLAWVFHGIALRDVFTGLADLNWWLVALALTADIASYLTQGLRWSLLLRPISHLSVSRATQAIYAGLFTNEVIPMRLGEIVRAFLAAQWLRIPLSVVASSIAAERFLDGLWLALTAGLLVLIVPLPRYLVGAEEILALVIFGATLLFLLVLFRHKPAAAAPSRSRLARLFDQFAASLRRMGGSRSFYSAGGVSSLILALQILAYWLVMEAYGLRLSIAHGAAILLILHLGTIVPGPPSNVGTYQFFTVLGLTLFGVDKATATGFSIVVFLLLTAPLWLLGLLAFGRAGLDPRHVRAEVMGILRKESVPGQAGRARTRGGVNR